MTNNGIKTRAILEAINNEHLGWMGKREYAVITYRDFVRACHQIDIVDPRTIKVKWEIMQDKDIFENANKHNARVDLYMFYATLGKQYLDDWLACTQTHTDTKTATQVSTEAKA